MSAKTKIYLWCFLVALSLRIVLIIISHNKIDEIDLKIYRDAGQLVANGVNPYDYNDNVELRQQLRTDKVNFDEYVSGDQDRWNYYANSNLPLATLFFGCIEYVKVACCRDKGFDQPIRPASEEEPGTAFSY